MGKLKKDCSDNKSDVKLKKYKLTVDLLKDMYIGVFWDEFYDKYKCPYRHKNISEMSIPIQDIIDCIEDELDKEMWYCSKVTTIKIIRYHCNNLGDVFKVRTMSNEDILIEYSYKYTTDILYFKDNTPLIKMYHILTNIYYNIKYSYVNFLCDVRYNMGNYCGCGLNVDIHKSKFIDIEKFIERNAEKYGIIYKYEKIKSLLDDKNSDVADSMIVYFIKDEWV